jgi:hypothetical protein
MCRERLLAVTMNSRRKVRNQLINFYVFYEVGQQEAEHALSLNNYHKAGTGDAAYQHWVLLEEKE